MKTRLLALNEAYAAYSIAPLGIVQPFDPYRFIDGLLGIRTANSLVGFLCDDNTGYLADPTLTDWKLEDGKSVAGLLYSKGRLDEAAYRHGVDYLDGFNDRKGYPQSLKDSPEMLARIMDELNREIIVQGETPSSGLPDDKDATAEFALPTVELLDISKLAAMKCSLSKLFTMAAIAVSEEAAETLHPIITVDRHTEGRLIYSIAEGNITGCPGIPDMETIEKYLLDLEPPAGTGVSWMWDRGALSLVSDGLLDYSAVARILCGSVVSTALTSITKKLATSSGIDYIGNRFISSQKGKAPGELIIDEAVKIVLNGRVGLCKICGAPFVKAYENGRATSKRTTCSDTCRARKSKGARADPGNGEEVMSMGSGR